MKTRIIIKFHILYALNRKNLKVFLLFRLLSIIRVWSPLRYPSVIGQFFAIQERFVAQYAINCRLQLVVLKAVLIHFDKLSQLNFDEIIL